LELLRREMFRWVRENNRPAAPEESPHVETQTPSHRLRDEPERLSSRPLDLKKQPNGWDADAFPAGAEPAGDMEDDAEGDAPKGLSRPLPKNVGRPRRHRKRRR